MIVLHELVEHVMVDVGHLLIDIDVFGFTYPRLEQLMITCLNKYQEYRPAYVKTAIGVNGSAVIKNAQRVVSMRPYTEMWEYVKPMDFKDWSWDVHSKVLTTTMSGDFFIEYLGKYTVENGSSLSYTTTELFPEETSISIPLLGHFKKGTLLVTLDEGTVPSEVFSVNITNSTFTVPNTSVLYTKLTQSSIVKVSSDTTLPVPLIPNYDYYVIKRADGTFQLSLTYTDSNIALKTFTTNFMVNPTYLTITAHGLSTNQAVQLSSTSTLPSPLVPDTTYYVNVINANTIELKPTTIGVAITLSNNGLGTHNLNTGFVDLTTTGTGIHSMTKIPFTMKEMLSSYSSATTYITLTGTMGDAILGLEASDVVVGNSIYSVGRLEMLIHTLRANFTESANLVISFNSQYKTIKELSMDEDILYFNLFKGELMKAVGTQKAITRIDGLPFDVSADDLYSKGDELVQKTIEDLTNSRSRWHLFR